VRYRLAKAAEDALVAIRVDSIERWGKIVANRYDRLIDQALADIAGNPSLPGAHEVPGSAGLKVYSIKSSRRRIVREDRIGNPRHLVVYRLASDGAVEILGVIHDRMLLGRAVGRLARDAEFDPASSSG